MRHAYQRGDLETVLGYLVGNHRCYPNDSIYLETIWFLAGQPKHLPPNILSSINVSDAEHRETLVAQVHHANSLGSNYLERLAQYIYLIPTSDWEYCEEPPNGKNGIESILEERKEEVNKDRIFRKLQKKL